MLCPSCRNENRLGSKFCELCGTPLPTEIPSQPNTGQPVHCLNCGQINKIGARFCENCGVNLDPPKPVESKMFCPSCGNETRTGVNFCDSCGVKLEKPKPIITRQVCSSCGVENDAGVKYCGNCGNSLLPKSSEVKGILCSECGFTNRPGIQFCEQCGAVINKLQKASPQKEPAPTPAKKDHRSLKKWGIGLAAIFLVLLIVGLLNNKKQPIPLFDSDTGPLVMTSGYEDFSTSASYKPGDFSISTYDDAGIDRIEVYSDGILVAAENIEGTGNTTVKYSPPLERLPIGEHEVIINTINSDGVSSQSQVIPIIITSESQEAIANSDPLKIDPSDGTLPAPASVSGSADSNNKNVDISWEPVENAVEYEIHVKPPDSSDLIHIETVDGNVSSYRLPVNNPGNWQVIIIPVDQDGGSGGMGSTSIFIPDINNQGNLPKSADETISYALINFTPPSNGTNSVYAYVLLGGYDNRFQRVPEQPGTFLESKNGSFSATVPGYDWPVNRQLQLNVFLWGWEGKNLRHFGSFEKMITPKELQSGSIKISNEVLTGSISLETHFVGGSQSSDSNNSIRMFDRPATLPPPYNLRSALYASDCAHTASQLGQLRDALSEACKISLMWNMRNFLMWEWPVKGDSYKGYSEKDLTGFEIRYRIIAPSGNTASEKTSSLPYPEARSYFVNPDELKQVVPCGSVKKWEIRAVGKKEVSDWVYIGSTNAETCPPPTPPPPPVIDPNSPPGLLKGIPEPIPNGCGGSNWTGEAVYDGIFHSACDKHDICYVSDWSGKSKVTCDNEFYDDMVEICDREYSGGMYAACVSRAATYYEGVNIAGGFFYKGDIDFLDCWRDNANEPFVCSIGALPQGVAAVYDGIAYGINETGELIELGAIEIKDGVVWIGKGVGKGTCSIWDIFPWCD